MPNTKTQGPTPLTIASVEDGSGFVEGFDAASFGASVAEVAKDAVSRGAAFKASIVAMVYATLIISERTLDENGNPSWNVGSWPESARNLRAAIYAAAGLSEDDSKDLDTSIRQALKRKREGYVACYVLDNVKGATAASGTEISTQEQRTYNAALELLPDEVKALLPSQMETEPFLPTGLNKVAKNAARKQYENGKLDVPVRFGGEPKDGNSKGTKDKEPASAGSVLQDLATQSISEHVGKEGGPSIRSILVGTLAVGSAMLADLIADSSDVTDRPESIALAERNRDTFAMIEKVLAGYYSPDEDAETVAAIAYNAEKDNS